MDKRITEMLIVDDLPFSHVQDIGFMRLMTECSPQYGVKQRKFYSSIICNEISDSVSTKTKAFLKNLKMNGIIRLYAVWYYVWDTHISYLVVIIGENIYILPHRLILCNLYWIFFYKIFASARMWFLIFASADVQIYASKYTSASADVKNMASGPSLLQILNQYKYQ